MRKTTDEILEGLRDPTWKQEEQNVNKKLSKKIDQLLEREYSVEEVIGNMGAIILLLIFLLAAVSVALVLVASGAIQ